MPQQGTKYRARSAEYLVPYGLLYGLSALKLISYMIHRPNSEYGNSD
mgnify:CR=1 FL=1